MATILPAILAWIAAAVAASLYWDDRRRRQRASRKPAPVKAPQAQAAVIEVVEKGRATDDTRGGSVIVPDDVRINGQSILIPRDAEIAVHEITSRADELTTVTLTVFARRVVIAAEGDLT